MANEIAAFLRRLILRPECKYGYDVFVGREVMWLRMVQLVQEADEDESHKKQTINRSFIHNTNKL